MAINPFEGQEQGDTIPAFAYFANDTSEGDGEYVDRLIQQSKKKDQPPFDKRYYYGRPAPAAPPLDAIKQALKVKEITSRAEPGTTEYFRARIANRSNCPLCLYDSWNTENLKEHIAQHRELREFADFWSNAAQEYSLMLERKNDLQERLAPLKKNLSALDDLIRKGRRDAAAARRVLEGLGSIDLACPLCPFVAEDIYELQKHTEGHEQIKAVLDREWRLQDRKEKAEMLIERQEVAIDQLQSRIKKFETSPDTRDLKRGQEQADMLTLLLGVY